MVYFYKRISYNVNIYVIQNEGGANEDGRAPSIWDTFARKHPGFCN